MYKIQQEIIEGISKSNLSKGSFLWVWNPSEISPHIGVSIDGKYFSLLANSVQKNVPITTLLELIDRKNKTVLFFDFENKISVQKVEAVFSNYTSCEENKCSCSAPLFQIFDNSIQQGLLFDLLDIINLNSCYSIGLTDSFKGIPKYTYEDVQNNLQKLVLS
jgi:hypothetical protein